MTNHLNAPFRKSKVCFNRSSSTSDRLFLSTSTGLLDIHVPLIYPPILPEIVSQVSVYDLAGENLELIATGETLSPITDGSVSGDDILLVESQVATIGNSAGDSLTQTHRLSRYRISEGSLVSQGDVELSGSSGFRVEVSDDGQTAVVVASSREYFGPAILRLSNEFYVELVDLSGEAPVIFDTVNVNFDAWSHQYEIGQECGRDGHEFESRLDGQYGSVD